MVRSIAFDRFLGRLGFGLLAVPVLAGPWFFGAWEMWWFWPFACFIFAATLVLGVRLMLPGQARAAGGGNRRPQQVRRLLLLSFAPFFVYALVRVLQAGVYMDAERSFLLLLTPFLVAAHIVFGFTRAQTLWIAALVIADLALLGLYGLVNHAVTGSALVMWAPGYPTYMSEHRATGSYFCPDHFSGSMELALCLALGFILDRDSKWSWRAGAAALAGIALAGIILSKSRGGGLTVLVIGAAALVWGFSQWPPLTRWCYRVSALSLAGIGLILFVQFAGSYTERFGRYFGWQRSQDRPWPEKRDIAVRTIMSTTRGRMIGAALRAWRENPVAGIGPGMHQNIWPHVAASPDGDRETGRWPSRLNNEFVSYEVHSDWVQLLEEYGLIGLALLLIPFCSVFHVLRNGLLRSIRERERSSLRRYARGRQALTLGAMLAVAAMTFHSFGDFNLQMPATTWLLAVMLAVPICLLTSHSRAAPQK